MDDEHFRIIVLGAGFARPAGLPLASELWDEIRKRTALLSGRAGKFHTDLEKYIRFKRTCDGCDDLTPETVDFEDFMCFLDIQHFLGLRGSDTWSEDGNEGTVVVKTLIGQILAERMPARVPDLYIKFACKLRPNDYVLTFNYDVLLEMALEAAGIPYRLFPDRYSDVHQHGATIDDSRPEVAVLKLHGSIDWFDRASHTELERERQRQGLTTPSGHPVFSKIDQLGVTKLLDGPRHHDDPLKEMYRVRDVKTLYQSLPMFVATPWLLAPSALKIVYAGKLRDFWQGLGKAGTFNFGLAVVGYSLPQHDDYARQVLYSIIMNYQQNYWNEELFGRRKRSLVVIDYCQDEAQRNQFMNRYRFVNWDRAILCDSGFDDHAVAQIFGESASAAPP